MDVAILTAGGAFSPAVPPAPPSDEPVLDEAFAALVDAGAFEPAVARPRVDEPRLGETPPLISLLPLIAAWQPATTAAPALDADAAGDTPGVEGEGTPVAIDDDGTVAAAGSPDGGMPPAFGPTAALQQASMTPAPPSADVAPAMAPAVADALPRVDSASALQTPARTADVSAAPAAVIVQGGAPALDSKGSGAPPVAPPGPDGARLHRETLPEGARTPAETGLLPPSGVAAAGAADPAAPTTASPGSSPEPRAENLAGETAAAPTAARTSETPARNDAARQAATAALARALSAVRGDDEGTAGRVAAAPVVPVERPVETAAAQVPQMPVSTSGTPTAPPEFTAPPPFAVQAVASGSFGFSREGTGEGQHEWYGRRPGVPLGPSLEGLASGVTAGAMGPMFTATPAARAEGPSGRSADVPDLTPQFVRSLRLQWRDGLGEAKFLLNPEHLGEVSVQLRVGPDGVSAHIQSASPLVRGWIAAHADDLRQALAEQGLDLGALAIDEPSDDGRRQSKQRSGGERRESGQASTPGETVDFASLL